MTGTLTSTHVIDIPPHSSASPSSATAALQVGQFAMRRASLATATNQETSSPRQSSVLTASQTATPSTVEVGQAGLRRANVQTLTTDPQLDDQEVALCKCIPEKYICNALLAFFCLFCLVGIGVGAYFALVAIKKQ